MQYLNKQGYKFGFLQENIEMVVYSFVCFFVPFLIGHPQWIVGIVVNASLVLAALNLRSYKLLPVIMLPSLAVLSRGMIFGPFTIFLVYMIPFIWIGNFILVFAIKKLTLNKKINRFFSLGIGAVAKALFLFAAAFIMIRVGFLPAVFLTAMGLMQLYTAIAGGLLAFGIHRIKKRSVIS
jgi:hypothetical protein